MCHQSSDPVRYLHHTQQAHSREGWHQPIRYSRLRVTPRHPQLTKESSTDTSPNYNKPLPTPGFRLSTTYTLPTGLRCSIGATLHRKPHHSQLQRPSLSGHACYTTSAPGSRGSQEPFADTDTKGGTALETHSPLGPMNSRSLHLLTHPPREGASAPPEPPRRTGGPSGPPVPVPARARAPASASASAPAPARTPAAHCPGPGPPLEGPSSWPVPGDGYPFLPKDTLNSSFKGS